MSSQEAMVVNHLVARGITDQRVLDAFRTVPREKFVPERYKNQAYADTPLPIGCDQTITQPYITALSCQLLQLKGDEVVLDIGTGSGYEAAILSLLVKEVYTMERISFLGVEAEERLENLGYDNVHVIIGDGAVGLPDHSPYGAIKAAAAAVAIPQAWKEQVAVGGRIVAPIRHGSFQELMLLTRIKEHDYEEKSYGTVMFVPLISGHN